MTKRCPSLKKHQPHSWNAMAAVGGDVERIEHTEKWPVSEIEIVKVRYDCPGVDNALERYIEMYGSEER